MNKLFLKMMRGIHQPRKQKRGNSCWHWKSSLKLSTACKQGDKSGWIHFSLFIVWIIYLD